LCEGHILADGRVGVIIIEGDLCTNRLWFEERDLGVLVQHHALDHLPGAELSWSVPELVRVEEELLLCVIYSKAGGVEEEASTTLEWVTHSYIHLTT
jgi:hypothetical protein